MPRVAPLLLFALAAAGGPRSDAVPLRDLHVQAFEGKGRLQRSRVGNRPGIFVGGERRRGLAWAAPGRARFDLGGDFARLTVLVAVPDGGKAPARFTVRGDGRALASTPPLFAGEEPVSIDVDVGGVRGLELAVDGAGAFGAWIDGKLYGAEDRDLGAYRALAVSFSPQEYPASFKRRVNESIDKGVRFLLTTQRADGTWGGGRHTDGVTALAALALLKAGVKRDDPAMVRAFERLAAYRFDHVYTVSVLLMALEARWFPAGADPKSAREVIPDADLDWIRRAAEWLAAQQGAGFPPNQGQFHPVWRYPQGGYDLSNTQYALFGLSAADRCGVRLSKVWLPALKYLLAMQEDSGPEVEVSRYFRDGRYARRRTEKAEARGFGYAGPGPPTGSMTSAGLCSLVLCQAALDGTRTFAEGYRKKTRRAIRDALAWLEEYYDVEENPFRGATWHLYYLFNMERVGVLLDQRYLGTHDWYEDGAEVLLASQGDNGAWGNQIDTAFALLFLKRGTVPPLTQGRRR